MSAGFAAAAAAAVWSAAALAAALEVEVGMVAGSEVMGASIWKSEGFVMVDSGG